MGQGCKCFAVGRVSTSSCSWFLIWWGSMPQCPERIGFQYGGQLGKHMYLLVKGLVAFGFVCCLGTENYFPWSLSAWCIWGWLLASVGLCCPWAFVFQVPFSILVWGSCKGSPLTMPAMCWSHRQHRCTGTHTVPTYRCCNGLWENTTMSLLLWV